MIYSLNCTCRKLRGRVDLKVKKELIARIVEYDILTDKLQAIVSWIAVAVLIIVLAAWPTTIVNYMVNPELYGVTSIGSSLLFTVLALLAGYAAYALPRTTTPAKSRSLKRVSHREKPKIVAACLSASLAVLAYLVFALTTLL